MTERDEHGTVALRHAEWPEDPGVTDSQQPEEVDDSSPGEDDAVAQAANWSAKQSFAGLVDYLLSTVGPRATAAGAGLKDARPLAEWREGRTPPREEVRQHRLEIVAETVHAITAEHSAEVAVRFLRSSQPTLDDMSPLVLISTTEIKGLVPLQAQMRGAVRLFLYN